VGNKPTKDRHESNRNIFINVYKQSRKVLHDNKYFCINFPGTEHEVQRRK
jgi:hypothetical protein